MSLVSTSTVFKLQQADLITLNLNNSDLITKTNITYILSSEQINLNNGIELINTIDGKYIYKVNR